MTEQKGKPATLVSFHRLFFRLKSHPRNARAFGQFDSDVDDVEFVPEQDLECNQPLQQAASVSSRWDGWSLVGRVS